jgi:hypothetical protein
MDVNEWKRSNMRTERTERPRHRHITPIHAALATAVLGLLVMPLAFSGAKPTASASGSSLRKQVKSLQRRLTILESRPAPPVKDGSITSDKIGDGAVTTPKLAPDAVAQNAINAGNAINAARLGGVPPGGCQQGWIKASAVIDTRAPLTDVPSPVPGFDCASEADDAIQIARSGTGSYEISIAGIDTAAAMASSAGPNTVASATRVQEGSLVVDVWANTTGGFVDGTEFTLIVF